jgi:hypothetical protein
VLGSASGRPAPLVFRATYSGVVPGRRPPRPSRLPESPLIAPKGKQAPAGWAEKIAEAIRARDTTKEVRRGRPVGFPNSFTKSR